MIECSLTHRDGSTRQFEILYTNLLDDAVSRESSSTVATSASARRLSSSSSIRRSTIPSQSCANRALLNERVRHALARARRDDAALAVIFLDLDDFKTINDSLGHAAGDRVLLEVAKRLATSIRARDTAARFGGDEFAILLEDTAGPQEVADTAERIIEQLETPLHVEGKEIVIRASLGISVADSESVSRCATS